MKGIITMDEEPTIGDFVNSVIPDVGDSTTIEFNGMLMQMTNRGIFSYADEEE